MCACVCVYICIHTHICTLSPPSGWQEWADDNGLCDDPWSLLGPSLLPAAPWHGGHGDAEANRLTWTDSSWTQLLQSQSKFLHSFQVFSRSSKPDSFPLRNCVSVKKTPQTGWTNQATKRRHSHTCWLTLAPQPEIWGKTRRPTSSSCFRMSPGNEPWNDNLWTHKQAATQVLSGIFAPCLASVCVRDLVLVGEVLDLYLWCIQIAHLQPETSWLLLSSGVGVTSLCLLSTLQKLGADCAI